MINIAINGFGRIGRQAFKALLDRPGLKVVAVNDLTDTATLAHLLKYDSSYGVYERQVKATANAVVVDNASYPVFAEKDPAMLPWQKLKVDIVIESTGRFTEKDQAMAHIKAGAKKVIISAPAKGGGVKTIVMGVNEDKLNKSDQIISNASCTTNCLAPATEVIRQAFGIKKAIMTTIHSYTADQVLVDGPHKDLRRARSAAVSMIPTTTGAAIAATEAIPQLKGLFDGLSVRVPTPVGSLSDMVFVLKKKVTVAQVNAAFKAAAKSTRMKGYLKVTDEPLVSHDIVGDPASCIIDSLCTKVVDGDLLKVVAWYDNEWGYSNRLADLCAYMGKKKLL